jgi:integrase
MVRERLTPARVARFFCPPGKQQSYLWDTEAPRLAVRATAGGAKSFVFEAKLDRRTIRRTIGDVRGWDLESTDPEHPGARQEARRLQALVDRGIDPRAHADEIAKRAEATIRAAKSEARRGALLVEDAWRAYLAHQRERMSRLHIEKGKRWGARHLRDHENLAQAGGQPKKRGKGTTTRGVLSPLLQLRLADVTSASLQQWQASEAAIRPNNARQGFEIFRTFWRWCATHPDYRDAIDPRAVEGKELRDEVPSRKSKRFDVLERSHLPAWFTAVRGLDNPVMAAYLQGLLLTGARREELAALRWDDLDFRWGSLWLKDKVAAEGRKVPLTPYLQSLLLELKRINETPPRVRQLRGKAKRPVDWSPSPWVFFSRSAADGRINEPRIPHRRALALAGLDHVTLHGLRRTFASLAEWVEMPQGVAAQIMGHKPSATAERHYINRPLELLALWHGKYERWILEQAGIEFASTQPANGPGLRVVGATA